MSKTALSAAAFVLAGIARACDEIRLRVEARLERPTLPPPRHPYAYRDGEPLPAPPRVPDHMGVCARKDCEVCR